MASIEEVRAEIQKVTKKSDAIEARGLDVTGMELYTAFRKELAALRQKEVLLMEGPKSQVSAAAQLESSETGSSSPEHLTTKKRKAMRGMFKELGLSEGESSCITDEEIRCLYRHGFTSPDALKVASVVSLMTAGVMGASAERILSKVKTFGQALTTTTAEVEAMVSKVASQSDDTMLYNTARGFKPEAIILYVVCFQWLAMWTQARWKASRRRVRAWGYKVLGRLVAGIIVAATLNSVWAGVAIVVFLVTDEPNTFEHYRREHFKDDLKSLLSWSERLWAQSELLDAMVAKVGREAKPGVKIGDESSILVHGRLMKLQLDTNALKARVTLQVNAAKLAFGNYL